MWYCDFSASHGVVTCGPFPALSLAQDFALSVDPELFGYSTVVFRQDG